MAVQGKSGTGGRKKPPIKVYRPPKHAKAVRQFDLAPEQAIGHRVNNMTRKEREVQFQMSGIRPQKKHRRRADTQGLDRLVVKKIKEKNAAEEIPVEFKTAVRENESVEKYEHRLRMEQLRIQRGMSDYGSKTSERKLEYKRDRRAQKQVKKVARLREDEKDEDFTGHTEHVAFGEVVERPPSFADMVLPGETLTLAGAQKRRPETNLELLQMALKTANSSVRNQFGGDNNDHNDDDDDNGMEDDPRKREFLAQQRKQKQKEREALLKVAREKQRQVDLEKAKLQAQAAYQQLKNKRGGDSKGKASMGSLTASTQTIYQAGVKAMRDLHSVDGGVYHHGK